MLSKTYTKYIQSLHHKKYRDAHNSFIAEGSKVVIELLASGKFEAEQLLGREAWLKENEPELRKHYSGPIQVIEDFELEKISALSTPNQVVGVFKKAKQQSAVVKGKLTLALDTIQDPGNLGTIIRIADWFGIHDIVCSQNCVELYNPKVVQSTMGSLGRVNVVYENIVNLLEQHKTIKSIAAALDGRNIKDFDKLKEAILIIGNESKGISTEILEMADEKITIPKIGGAESLNAAVAAGIILSHIKF
ncbi:MAG: RNA methyltransferase [Ferruginibacter sp.]